MTRYEEYMVKVRVEHLGNMIDIIEGKTVKGANVIKMNEVFNVVVQEAGKYPSPHEDEKAMGEMDAGVEFYDDMNTLSKLDRKLVIKARIEEITFSRK